MQSSEILRRKTAMIIYSIEISLANFLRENNIQFNEETINFAELFQLALKIQTNDSNTENIKKLNSIFEFLELTSVRNSCAHASRDFKLNDWYKAAYFASSPVIQLLNFNSVIDSLACAESGKISDPPLEWVDRIKIKPIPNNLPEKEKFDITGLIGRQKETELIINTILQTRVSTLTIVGPGGVGKTSIAIEAARKISAISNGDKKFDAVVYLTFKQTELTQDGPININNEFINDEIFTIFAKKLKQVYQTNGITDESVMKMTEDDKILIVLDNFEDLILESSEICNDFLNKLPSQWKVLISSRISFDNSKNIPINSLTLGAVETLARRYHESKTGKSIEKSVLENIKESCNGNPLSLKLMIDRLCLGHEVSEAKSITQNEILEFSFSSLIKSLNEKQSTLLESIFLFNEASKVDLLELTELSNEDLIENLNILNKTSLIERKNEERGDIYIIATSLRDLLARSPLNLEIRNFFAKKLSNLRIKQKNNIPDEIIDTFSFEKITPIALINIGGKLAKLSITPSLTKRDYDYVKNFEEKINNYEGECRNFVDFYRLKSFSRIILKDNESALNFAQKAYSINKHSLPAAHLYSLNLINSNKNLEAREVLSPFIKDLLEKIKINKDILNEYGASIARETFSSFFKTHIWENSFDEVIEYTKNWKAAPEFLKITFIISRSAAIRRKYENFSKNSNERCESLLDCAKLIKYAYEELDAPNGILEKEARKIHHELTWSLDYIDTNFKNHFLIYSNFLNKYLLTESNNNSDLNFEVENKLNENNIEKTECTIYSIHKTFCFGRCKDNVEYFIPFASFGNYPTPSIKNQKSLIWNINKTPDQKNGTYRASNAQLI